MRTEQVMFWAAVALYGVSAFAYIFGFATLTIGVVLAVFIFWALLGSLLVAAVAVTFFPASNALWLILAGSLGGLTGSLGDSIIGATLQGIYTCPTCKKETERHPLHSCGTKTVHLRGWRWVNNEVVNFSCSLIGAMVAVALWVAM